MNKILHTKNPINDTIDEILLKEYLDKAISATSEKIRNLLYEYSSSHKNEVYIIIDILSDIISNKDYTKEARSLNKIKNIINIGILGMIDDEFVNDLYKLKNINPDGNKINLLDFCTQQNLLIHCANFSHLIKQFVYISLISKDPNTINNIITNEEITIPDQDAMNIICCFSLLFIESLKTDIVYISYFSNLEK
jgi:purine-nucleoside phosphorylase